jgi:hypothetical protein
MKLEAGSLRWYDDEKEAKFNGQIKYPVIKIQNPASGIQFFNARTPGRKE